MHHDCLRGLVLIPSTNKSLLRDGDWFNWDGKKAANFTGIMSWTNGAVCAARLHVTPKDFRKHFWSFAAAF